MDSMASKRKIMVLLLVVSVVFVLAAGLVLGRRWFLDFGIGGISGPLLLLLPIARFRTQSSESIVMVASAAFALLSGIGLVLAFLEPLAAVGVSLTLLFGWSLSIAVILLVTYVDRPQNT